MHEEHAKAGQAGQPRLSIAERAPQAVMTLFGIPDAIFRTPDNGLAASFGGMTITLTAGEAVPVGPMKIEAHLVDGQWRACTLFSVAPRGEATAAPAVASPAEPPERADRATPPALSVVGGGEASSSRSPTAPAQDAPEPVAKVTTADAPAARAGDSFAGLRAFLKPSSKPASKPAAAGEGAGPRTGTAAQAAKRPAFDPNADAPIGDIPF